MDTACTPRGEIVTLENVSYSYEGNRLINDISISICLGEDIVFFGAENSGIDFICQLIVNAAGEFEGDVFFDGRPIKDFDEIEVHNFRKGFGYLQRNFGLINNMDVFENIALPLRYHSRLTSREVDERVESMVEYLKLEHCARRRPVHLSSSELLRTSYGRSIALDPDLLLIEHPLEEQCLLNVQVFMSALQNRAFAPHKSVIIITYRPELYTEISERFVMLHEGRIVFDGSTDEFARAENPYVKQFLQASIDGPMQML